MKKAASRFLQISELEVPEAFSHRIRLPKAKAYDGYLPIAYGRPFKFLRDVVIDDVTRVARARVTLPKSFVRHHFPGQPVNPGCLHMEAVAQLGAFLMMHTHLTKNEGLSPKELLILMGQCSIQPGRPAPMGTELVAYAMIFDGRREQQVVGSILLPDGKSSCFMAGSGRIVTANALAS